MEPRAPEPAPIDRYVVLEYLAEGGMGAIYLGKKMGAGGFEKQVVLKQLLPEFTRQPEFIELFLREARLSATLDHANIIHTIDLVTAGEDYFIVMEFLDGADLRTLLKRARKRRQRFGAAAAIYVARELLSALAYAHNKLDPDGLPLRLIHRDISPSNILVSAAGEVKLTDFGIAKASTHNSVFYRVKGKVGYMSPEQAQSDPLDARSDLYSLAVCLYEMISGERLFLNVGLTTSVDEMYGQAIPLLSHKVAGLPPELDKIMLKALSRDVEHRYQTAGEFQAALLRCAHRHGLMLSAPELSDHLIEICGDPSSWRASSGGAQPRAGGTERFDFDDLGGTEQLDVPFDSEVSVDSDMIDVALDHGDAAPRGKRGGRAQTSITRLTALKDIQLTSLINLAASDQPGAAPLVDFDDLAASPNLPSATAARPPPRPTPPGLLPDATPVPTGAPPPPTVDGPAAPPGVAGAGLDLAADRAEPALLRDRALADLDREDAVPVARTSERDDESTGIVVGHASETVAPPRPQPSPERGATAPAPLASAPRRPGGNEDDRAGWGALRGRPTWIAVGLILAAGLATAAAIGLSGPTIGGAASVPLGPPPPAPARAAPADTAGGSAPTDGAPVARPRYPEPASR